MKILYDTDFLINLFVNNEPNHKKTLIIQDKIKLSEYSILNLVTYEFAAVLSRKFNQEFALDILKDFEKVKNIKIVTLNENLEIKTWKLFKSFTKKNISFIDCANLTIAQNYNFKIASFDKFYPKNILLA